MATSPNYRWYIVGATLFNQAFSVGILIYSFALFVVPWLELFEVSRGQMMLAIVSLQICVGALSPWLGRMLDTGSLRRLVMIGAACASTGLLLLSLATAFWQVLLIHATLLPVGMVLCGTLASQTMVSKWFVDGRGFAIGISSMGTSIGGFIFPLVTSGLMTAVGWQSTLLILAIASVVILLPLNFFILGVDPPPPPEVRPGDEVSPDHRVWTSREILTTRMFWIPVMGLVPINAAFGGVQFNLGAYIADLGLEQSFAAQLISVMSISMIGGKFLFGTLGDRVDHRYLHWLMFLLLAIALVLFMGSPGQPALLAAAAFQGLATGGVMPMMGIVYASRFGALSFGRVAGFVNLFLMTGSFGSILSGFIFDTTGSYDAAFVTFLVLLLPAAIALYWLPPPGWQAEDDVTVAAPAPVPRQPE